MPVDNTTSSETELLLRDDRFTANNCHTSCSSVVPQSSDNGYIKSKIQGENGDDAQKPTSNYSMFSQ
jgi:hypothetical protein